MIFGTKTATRNSSRDALEAKDRLTNTVTVKKCKLGKDMRAFSPEDSRKSAILRSRAVENSEGPPNYYETSFESIRTITSANKKGT